MRPFHPQPLERLRQRYPAALATIYDTREFVDRHAGRPHPRRPSASPAHIFDHEDGLRLMVSRERMPLGELVTHISASVCERTPLARALATAGPSAAPQLLRHAVRCWQTLAQVKTEPQLIGLSEGKQIPHWFVRTPS